VEIENATKESSEPLEATVSPLICKSTLASQARRFLLQKMPQKYARIFQAEHNKVNWSDNSTEEFFSNPWG